MTPLFEPATAADILLIRDLAERIWYGSYCEMISAAQIRYMLDVMYAPHKLAAEIERGVHYCLLHWERKPAGFSAWELLSPEPVAHLHKLYLLPEFHGRGAGRAMILRFLDEAQAAGAVRAELRVNKANARAQRAYLSTGFQVIESVTTPIGCGYVMDDYVMRLEFNSRALQSDKGGSACE